MRAHTHIYTPFPAHTHNTHTAGGRGRGSGGYATRRSRTWPILDCSQSTPGRALAPAAGKQKHSRCWGPQRGCGRACARVAPRPPPLARAAALNAGRPHRAPRRGPRRALSRDTPALESPAPRATPARGGEAWLTRGRAPGPPPPRMAHAPRRGPPALIGGLCCSLCVSDGARRAPPRAPRRGPAQKATPPAAGSTATCGPAPAAPRRARVRAAGAPSTAPLGPGPLCGARGAVFSHPCARRVS